MFAVCALALMPCLMSVGRSAPMVCEELVRPLDQPDPHHLVGKWALVAGGIDYSRTREELRLTDSVTMYVSSTNSSNASTGSYIQVNRFREQCEYQRCNVSLQGSDFHCQFFIGSFLRTSCPDCLVANVSMRRFSTDLFLLSRRRELEQREMDEFREQLKCYQLPAAVVMDPTKELCPELPESRPTAAPHTEETTAGQ